MRAGRRSTIWASVASSDMAAPCHKLGISGWRSDDPAMPPPGVPVGARKIRQQGSSFYVVGDERAFLRDAYHTFLRLPWIGSFAVIAAGFFAANLIFAAIYLVVGGVGGTDGGFVDALSFSVQTMATIGYGVMHPSSGGATTRVAFSQVCVITKFEGKPTLMFRVGNRRSNVIVEATIHLVCVVTTQTAEGETFYKAHDLKLVRDRQVGMTRGWTVMHEIDQSSPLYGLDSAGLAKAEAELYIALTGIDDVTVQTIHTIHRYVDTDIRVSHRFVDTMQALPDGTFLVDLSKFDQVVPDSTPRDSVRA
jgi:inward rectifier potassium channel